MNELNIFQTIYIFGALLNFLIVSPILAYKGKDGALGLIWCILSFAWPLILIVCFFMYIEDLSKRGGE